jgi:integrase/recombinase XerC
LRDSKAAVTAHLEWMRQRGLSPGTILYRKRLLTRLAGELPRPILAATPRDLARWRAALTVAPATIVHYVSHARSFYDWALAAKLITANPAAGLPVPKTRRGMPRPIAENDLMAAVQAAPERIRPWLVLAAWCGLRAKEIAFLRAENILSRAHPPVILVAAEASKGGRERIVPMSAVVVAELAGVPMPSRGWAFGRLDGRGGPNQPWVVSQLAGEHLRSCGIPASLHQLRHYFGTTLYRESGHDLRLTQELLGHANMATTAVYADWDRASAMPALDRFPLTPRHQGGQPPPAAHTG